MKSFRAMKPLRTIRISLDSSGNCFSSFMDRRIRRSRKVRSALSPEFPDPDAISRTEAATMNPSNLLKLFPQYPASPSPRCFSTSSVWKMMFSTRFIISRISVRRSGWLWCSMAIIPVLMRMQAVMKVLKMSCSTSAVIAGTRAVRNFGGFSGGGGGGEAPVALLSSRSRASSAAWALRAASYSSFS